MTIGHNGWLEPPCPEAACLNIPRGFLPSCGFPEASSWLLCDTKCWTRLVYGSDPARLLKVSVKTAQPVQASKLPWSVP